MKSEKRHFPFHLWIVAVFFLSGATGIVYEVVWTRLLTLVMGNTQFSVAAVLTAFMAGLALGSWIGGRYIDGFDRPLVFYARLEGAIGVYCLLIPTLIELATPALGWIYRHFQNDYATASFLRFLVSTAVLIVPTTLMGATLPALGKFVSRDAVFIGRDVGALYAINTFGAVAGAFTSAFVFMRLFGLHNTIRLAAFANLAIAAGIILFAGRRSTEDVTGEASGTGDGEENLPEEKHAPLALWCFAVSGVCAMVYQTAWTRIFSLLLGSSVYAFSLILTVFILGLASGTAVFAGVCSRRRDPLAVFGYLQLGIAVAALAVLPLFGEIPFLQRWIYRNWGVEFATMQWANLGIIFALLFPATFCMGAQFPVVVRLVARRLSTLGRHVGEAYAVNTLGAIAGSFCGGFIFIPMLGVQNSVMCAALVNAALAVVLLGFAASVAERLRYYGLPLVFGLCVWAAYSIPPWDKAVITSGAYMPYRIDDLKHAELRKNRILYFKEGVHTTVTTELTHTGNIFLRVNGKADASLALDMRTQLLSGYLPMFLHPNPRRVLVVGQGSGITLGAVEQFPIESVDLVEISREVIDGSRFFSPFNHRSLDDKRLNVILEDGRNHVALTESRYDVIVSEPSNPWISGVGALFTRDFFELARRRLNPGGVFCIWIHTNLSPVDFKSIVGTFIGVFPHATLWESIVGDDYLLIGSDAHYYLPYEKVAEQLAEDTAVAADLRRIGIRRVEDLMSLMMTGREGLEKFSAGAPTHTDDNALLEFGAPEYLYKDERSLIVRQIEPHVHIDPALLHIEDPGAERRRAILDGIAALTRSQSQVEEIKRHARIDVLLDQAARMFQGGDAGATLEKYREILKLDPEHVLTLVNMASVYTALRKFDEAEAALKRAVAVNPFHVFGHLDLARLYIAAGRAKDAETLLRGVVDWLPRDKEVRVTLGVALSMQKSAEEAVREWQLALETDPGYDLPHYYLGVQYQSSHPATARAHLEKFLALRRAPPGEDRLAANARKLLKNL